MELLDDCNNSSENNSFRTGNHSSEFLFKNPFHDTVTKALFITCYAAVFAACILGNLIVLFAITNSPRLRSMTNFFLANLAVADFCVGIFCVLPNLSTCLSQNWILGKAMCKIYYYVWNVSYTASIIILTVIAVERYIAIIYPLKAKYFRRRRILIGILLVIWMVALVYNVPYLIFYDTLSFVSLNIEYCYFYHRNLSGLQGLSLANLIVWYVLPLCVIGAMYVIIGTTLWKTQSQTSTMYLRKCNSLGSSKSPSQDSTICDMSSFRDQQSPILDNSRFLRHENNTSSTQLINEHSCDSAGKYIGQRQRNNINTKICKRSPLNTKTESRKINGERRKVIRLLVVVVVSFAVCVLPHHLRVLNHFWNIVNLPHSVEVYFAPVSFLVLYVNSCLNPILYALFSTNFRKAFKESLTCLKSQNRRQIKSKFMSSHSVV